MGNASAAGAATDHDRRPVVSANRGALADAASLPEPDMISSLLNARSRHQNIDALADFRPRNTRGILSGDAIEDVQRLVTKERGKPAVRAFRHINLGTDAIRFLKGKLAAPVG